MSNVIFSLSVCLCLFEVLVNFICCILCLMCIRAESQPNAFCDVHILWLKRCRILNKIINNHNSFNGFAFKYKMQINNIIALCTCVRALYETAMHTLCTGAYIWYDTQHIKLFWFFKKSLFLTQRFDSKNVHFYHKFMHVQTHTYFSQNSES